MVIYGIWQPSTVYRIGVTNMRKIYVNEEVCIACGLCSVYCHTEHSRSKDIIKAFKKGVPRPLPRIRVERKAEVSFAVQCRHCDEPWCVYACLAGAIYRDPISRVVKVTTDKCIGCWTCLIACPYGALTRDISNSLVVKCDLCPEQVVPVCVANCPNEALVLAADEESSTVHN